MTIQMWEIYPIIKISRKIPFYDKIGRLYITNIHNVSKLKNIIIIIRYYYI